MSALRPAPERRGDPRITPKGAVIVGVDTYVIRGRVANLSRHGLLARTWITAPERLLGARANLGLRLDGGDADWIQLTGRILRIGSRTIAIALDGAPPGFTRTLDQAVSRSHRNDRAVTVVLVDGDVERRHAIADGFRAAGCEVVNASTPLEAIVRLGGSDFEPDLIAVAQSVPAVIADELRRFVAAEHPQAMLVTIGDAAAGLDHVGTWLSAADGGGELAARIRDVLSRFLPH